MRWGDMRPSDNVEDRRGEGGGGRGFPMGGGGMRLGGGALILIVVVSLLFGVNPMSFLGMVDTGAPGPSAPAPPARPAAPANAKDDASLAFVQRTLGDTEDVWSALFKNMGSRYDAPRLVLFAGSYPSACGMADTAAGPFYCPGDRKVYLDTAFFGELARRFGAPGDFAQAYVIAHEVGHHVQNLIGVFDRGDARSNEVSIARELQADCFAGVWGYSAAQRGRLEPGDIEEGLQAAAAIGDDRIQRRTQGQVTPETWTHGSSEQRVRWFRQGLTTGRADSCDPSRGGQ